MFFDIVDSEGKVLARNFDSSKEDVAFGRSTSFDKEGLKFVIYSTRPDFKKSNSLFKRCSGAVGEVFLSAHNFFTEQLVSMGHTLTSLQIQAKQKIEGIIDKDTIIRTEDYSDLKNHVVSLVRNDPEEAAETLIYLEKRIFEIGAHLKGFELIHQGKRLRLDARPQNVRSVLFNVAHAFFDDFEDNSIKVVVNHIDLSFAESHKISFDYSTMNVALYNFYLNATKYCLPGSAIYHDFTVDEVEGSFNLCIKMRSLRIEKNELQTIFDYGTRGISAKNIEGSGVGLFVMKKALELNNMEVRVEPDYSKSEKNRGDQYIQNTFIISGEYSV
ncbi:MAG: hypothetical protein V1738_02045 [Patescibacteria group bacterium]